MITGILTTLLVLVTAYAVYITWRGYQLAKECMQWRSQANRVIEDAEAIAKEIKKFYPNIPDEDFFDRNQIIH